MNTFDFSGAVLNWYQQHGRKDLPWQQNPSAYRVWVSEIMLQQTQVSTVIGYYQRFMQHFPTLLALAQATADQVLAQWSGLGYYARARNLHKTAQIVTEQFGGQLPQDINQLIVLPGIGRSTAGAILSLACKQRQPILDGNVRRVLARYFVIEGWPVSPQTARVLWAHAEKLTPQEQVDHYTQAMIDIGATLCTRTKPACDRCPLQKHCNAYKQNRVGEFPHRKPKKTLPVRHQYMLLLQNQQGEILLEKRPPSGLWGGLLGLPMFDRTEQLHHWCEDRFGEVEHIANWPLVRHTFSHFHMDIAPVHLRISTGPQSVMDAAGQVWYKGGVSPGGLAAPVSRLLNQFFEQLLEGV